MENMFRLAFLLLMRKTNCITHTAQKALMKFIKFSQKIKKLLHSVSFCATVCSGWKTDTYWFHRRRVTGHAGKIGWKWWWKDCGKQSWIVFIFVGSFFHAISCIPVFQETSRPDVKASCKELPAEKRRTLFEAGKEGETSYGLQQGSPGHYW